MSNPTNSYIPPEIKNVAPKPPGVLPRNLQTWAIAGIAVAMVVIISITGDKTPQRARAAVVSPPQPADPSPPRIQEYSARIEAEAKKLAAEQAELNQAKAALATQVYARPTMSSPNFSADPPRVREKTWAESEDEKREYQARFSSNLVLSLRDQKASSEPTSPSLKPETSGRGATSLLNKDSESSNGTTYRLFEGSWIETTLTNRLNGSFSGPVNCMVTNDIYSHDRIKLLIPAGSRVLGEVRPVESLGQQRLAVSFHRIVLPNGLSISLDDFTGLNQIGETGLRDKVDHHFLQIFGVSTAIGAIAGLAQANTSYGNNVSGVDVYSQGVSNSLSQSSLRILDRYLNVLPTLTIEEGHRVNVYLLKDLSLPAYAPVADQAP